MNLPLNLAHRGFSGSYPENTLMAFEKAVDEGDCQGFETDVHLSADGEPVIIHDPELSRTTTGSGRVREHTYKELRALDAGTSFHPRFTGQKIPHLREVLELAKSHGLLVNLELKNYEVDYQGLVEIVAKLVQAVGVEDRVILSSFNHISMAACAEKGVAMPTGLLYMQPLYHAERYGQMAGANALHPHYRLLDLEPGLVERSRALGLRVHTWTVNEESDLERMIRKGVDSIITNHPDRLSRLLAAERSKR